MSVSIVQTLSALAGLFRRSPPSPAIATTYNEKLGFCFSCEAGQLGPL
jgi:hypothetical protein